MTDRLQTLLEPTVEGLGYELLGIERRRGAGGQLLRLYIDRASGITVADCERVSRQVGDVLDAEQAIRGEYTLEVSSPGIERPLFTLAQHQRYLGATIAIRLRSLLAGRRRLKGVLREVTADGLVVEFEGEHVAVPFREIERSQLAPTWSAQDFRGRGTAAD